MSGATIAVYGTGICAGANAGDIGCSGGLVSLGTADNNWQLQTVPGGTSGGTTGVGSTVTEAPAAGKYVVADQSSQISEWIDPTGGYNSTGNSPPLWYQDGTYEYQTTFSLSGMVASSTVLNLSLAADNLFAVIVDGSTVFQSSGVPCVGDGSVGSNCYAAFNNVTINNALISGGFLAGLNTIDIVVTNTSPVAALCADATTPCSPTGLRVELTGTANAIPGVPEPGTWGMLSAGLAGLAFVRRRRRA